MTTKPTNLRFLLSLGSTKMVVLQDEEDVHIYSNQVENVSRKKSAITVEHISEAIAPK